MLYPLIFKPLCKSHLWGGRKLERLYGKSLPPNTPIGESWEITDRPEGVSVIANGPLAGKDLRWLLENHAAEVLGASSALGGRFPLLVKILDCQEAPSLQVHPRPDVAERDGGEPKTEMWYVADAAAESHLYVGLRTGVKRLQFERKIGDGSVLDCLHQVRVRVGDAMFVPSGRVHSIGAGLVVFEIQQNSNTTYRVFDWNRKGPDGQPRPLHVEQAMASIDFDDFEPGLIATPFQEQAGAQTRSLVDDPLFAVEEWRVPANYREPLPELDRPLIVAVVTGSLAVRHGESGTTLALGPGQCCLVPASVKGAVLESDSSATYLLAEPGVAPRAEAESSDAQQRPVVPVWKDYEEHWRSRTQEPPKTSVIPSRRRLKKELTKRLTYSPFLKLLILNVWFRLAVFLLLLVIVGMGLFLPKIWRTTPPGFMPVVRISLLDRMQAANLRRTAERAARAKQYEEAFQAWRNACGNNLGDPDLARGMLQTLIAEDPSNSKHYAVGVQTALWLLRLTETNRADLELATRFYDRIQLSDLAYQQLNPLRGELSGFMQMAYVKSLFFENHMTNFVAEWSRLTAEQKADPELTLLRAAYEAGWGPPDTSAEGKRRLAEAATTNSPHRVLANRLQLAVSSYLADVSAFGEALKRLQEAHADTGVDHAGYWRLLAESGRKDEALRLAQDYVFPPKSSAELVRLAGTYDFIGMTSESLRLMKRYAMTFWYVEDVWTLYASLLEAEREWDELRSIAVQMRRLPGIEQRLKAVSLFYEGRAQLGQNEGAMAQSTFDSMAREPFPSTSMAYRAVSSLMKLGQTASARTVLLNLPAKTESSITNEPYYWSLMFSVAVPLQDEALLYEAARAGYLQQPHNLQALNRYAAALLVRGDQPEEAVRVTLDLVSRLPGSKAARLNHVLALLSNRRPNDAQSLLAEVVPETLTAEESNSYHQALFQLQFQLQQFDEAWETLARLDMNRLFPGERKRIEDLRKLLPPRRR